MSTFLHPRSHSERFAHSFTGKASLMLCFFLCCCLYAHAQRPLDLAERAMSAGRYEEAISYYQKAYEISNDDAITKKINLAQSLKNEFDAIDDAILRGDFSKAEIHINNVLLADPDNKIVDQKREKMKEISAANKRSKRRSRTARFLNGFEGDGDIHKSMGGLRFGVGGTMSKIGSLGYTPGFDMQLEYSHFKSFPFRIHIDGIVFGDYNTVGGGLGSSYLFTDHFSFDYGLGWQKTWWMEKYPGDHFYFDLGLTLMFNAEKYGGLRYNYKRSIYGVNEPVSTHKLTYVMGRGATFVTFEFSLIIIGAIAYIKTH